MLSENRSRGGRSFDEFSSSLPPNRSVIALSRIPHDISGRPSRVINGGSVCHARKEARHLLELPDGSTRDADGARPVDTARERFFGFPLPVDRSTSTVKSSACRSSKFYFWNRSNISLLIVVALRKKKKRRSYD